MEKLLSAEIKNGTGESQACARNPGADQNMKKFYEGEKGGKGEYAELFNFCANEDSQGESA